MRKKGKNTLAGILIKLVIGIFIVSCCAFTIYPVIYALVGSFKTNQELTLGGSFFPAVWMFSNYKDAFIQADFLRYTGNTVIVAVSSTIIALITTVCAGFVLARYNFVGKKLISGMYLGCMFISMGAVSLQPVFLLLRSLGLTKTLAGLILAVTGPQTAMVFLVSSYVKGVPKELDEAAIIDGCGTFGILRHVIIPMITPVMGVVGLFAFRAAWNDYVTTLIMTIPHPHFMTLSVAVAQLKYSMNAAAEWHIMLAGASIAIIPILIVYLFANKQFIAGLTAGAVKG